MQEPSSKSLKEGLFKALNENRFSFGVSKEYFGPKRISINIKNVSPKQLDVVEEKRGPRADANDKAIDGFAKSLGVSRNELKLKKTPEFINIVERIDLPKDYGELIEKKI